jgi:hypothetical protein
VLDQGQNVPELTYFHACPPKLSPR